MLMSDLIEQYRANPGGPTNTLVRALVKTGPLYHDGSYYSGQINGSGHTLNSGTQVIAGAQAASEVDVPAGSYPGVDPELDALRGTAIALKVSSGRILNLIDGAIDKTGGQGGLAGVIAALNADQVAQLQQIIDTAEEALPKIKGMLAP